MTERDSSAPQLKTVTQPATTQPATTQPAATQPATTQPAATSPSQPVAESISVASTETVNIQFRAFDNEAEIQNRHRFLPHWFQPNVATFITFRTNDSLPLAALTRMKEEMELWLTKNNLPVELAESQFVQRRPNHDDLLGRMTKRQYGNYREMTKDLYEGSLDQCHGECYLERPGIAQIVADCILRDSGSKYDVASFVIMPNHVHAIAQFREGFDFSIVGQTWMRLSARRINQQLGLRGAFWRPEPHDHLIRSSEQFTYHLNYIRENPRKANLATGRYLLWPE